MPMKAFLNALSRLGSRRRRVFRPASKVFEIVLRRLRQLTGKRLGNETDIGPARAAKFRPVEILGCTFRTKHSYLPSYSTSVLRRLASIIAELALRVLCSSLSQRFIENDPCCDRNVE